MKNPYPLCPETMGDGRELEALVRRLLHQGTFYPSAVELDPYCEDPLDGEELEEELRRILELPLENSARQGHPNNRLNREPPQTCPLCDRPAFVDVAPHPEAECTHCGILADIPAWEAIHDLRRERDEAQEEADLVFLLVQEVDELNTELDRLRGGGVRGERP